MGLELTGDFYVLYLEGCRDEQLYQSGLGAAFSTGRFRYHGQGSITRERGETVAERFLFLTEESIHDRLDAPSILTPVGFDDCQGWSMAEITDAIRNGSAPRLIDAFAAGLLDDITRWRQNELGRKEFLTRRVLIPTVMLRPPTRQMVELGFAWKTGLAQPWD